MQVGGCVAKESMTITTQNLFTNSGVKHALLFSFRKNISTIEGNIFTQCLLGSEESPAADYRNYHSFIHSVHDWEPIACQSLS